MTYLTKKRAMTGGFLLLGCIGLIFAARYGGDKYHDVQDDKFYAEKIERLYSYVEHQMSDDFHYNVDVMLDFVRAHSEHNEDEEFLALWPDRMKLADAVLDHVEGRRDSLPHMECSTRSNILSAMLQQKGYRVRNIVLYQPEYNLSNHRIIEVLNPEAKKWEAYDVTYDVHWENRIDGTRASIAEVGAAPDNYHPCIGRQCGWNLSSSDKQEAKRLREYIKIAAIHDKESDLRVSLHDASLDPQRVYTGEGGKVGTFCDLFGKNCVQGFKPFPEYEEKSAK